jgi:Fuc2NAc and GlcNAc transferase
LGGFSFSGDRIDISPSWRLLFHFAASLIVLFGYWMVPSSLQPSGMLIIPLAFFIVASANYYTFMDGINDIAGITWFIGFGLLAVFVHNNNADPALKFLCICLSLKLTWESLP